MNSKALIGLLLLITTVLTFSGLIIGLYIEPQGTNFFLYFASLPLWVRLLVMGVIGSWTLAIIRLIFD